VPEIAPELWVALEYDRVAADVATSLSEGADVDVIEGPPGVGKSSLARYIGGLWESGGGSAVVAEGDLLKSDASLYPFDFALVGLAAGWKSMGPAIAGIARAGETFVGTAGLITTTIEALAKRRRDRRKQRAILLGDREQHVLSHLERLSRKRPLLLIADNLHWWDPDSLDMLRRLRDERMWAAFPFLTEMRVLAVQTPPPFQTVAHPDAHGTLLAPGGTRRFTLERIPREGFERVLAALGAGDEPAPEVADVVHQLSGGHLALASRCAARIASGETEALLSAAGSEEFLQRLLTERIDSLGALGRQAVQVLQVAAVVGLAFRRDEVACAAGEDEAEIARLLRDCRRERVLELADDRGWFVHDLYRQYFLSVAALDVVGIHERLADCLRTLRPAEYELRCVNAVRAERPREAAALAVQAALQRQRDGRPWRDLSQPILDAMETGGRTPVAERLTSAFEALSEYRFDDCMRALSGLPHDLDENLAAERDYLQAMCLMSTRSEHDRETGRATLRPWVGHEEHEPELGGRLLQGLLYGLTHLRDKQPGQELAGHMRRFLVKRSAIDHAAEDALYVLDRCAGSLYHPDISVMRNRDAVEHFAPEEGQTVLRRPLEYYRCLNNYGAGLISNARYEEAIGVYQELERLVAEYTAGVFPRLDFPRMNMLLAEYRLGMVDAEQAVGRQRALIAECRIETDPFYVDNALAVYLALAGHHEEAIETFDGLDGMLARSRAEPEPSMVYLIRANRCATRFVAGDVATAQREWEELTGVVDRIAYVIRTYLVRRHELLADVIASGETITAREFDERLAVRGAPEFGPLWDNFGRGFRMPEVEFWREN
jgi:hypothetical protein